MKMKGLEILQLLCFAILTNVKAFVEFPKFSQLTLLYPGYFHHGGQYRDREILDLIGGNHTLPLKHAHNTSPLRISYMLNKYGGRHSMGTEPILLSNKGLDSITGQDGQVYIFRNTAFGPFLAAKYGNPVLVKPNKYRHDLTMAPFHGRQGIVRLVSYHRDHAGGHIALWDCDHFYKSQDWTEEHHLIAVEFWESPDSMCPQDVAPPVPHLQAVDPDQFHVVPRHNFDHKPAHHGRHPQRQMALQRHGNVAHPGEETQIRHGRHRTSKGVQETLWIQ